MKKFKIAIAAVVIGLVTAVAVMAQPTIPEMKLMFNSTWATWFYDANPSNETLTRVMDIDGDDAQVNVTGSFTASGGINKTFTNSFTPNGIAATPAAILTIAGLVSSAVAQQLNLLYLENGQTFIFAQSTAQTVLPIMSAVGLEIGCDLVSGEAIELFTGVLGATGAPFVVGVDPAFKFCVTATVTDASGVSDLHIGFRDANVTQTATIGSYLNYATIGLEGTSNPNTIQIMTGNDGTDTVTDTTDTMADGDNDKFCVLVSAAGVVTYTVDGAAPTTTAAFTFDDGDSVIPFLQFQHGGDVASEGGVIPAVELTEWEVAYQSAGRNP